MGIKVYISGMSGNKEVKKRQQRVLMILDSKCIKYDVIDITEPGAEADKEFMQTRSLSKGGTVSDPEPRSALPPQLFNDEEYCGDYDQFDLANEIDTLEQFLKIAPPEPEVKEEVKAEENKENEEANKETTENENPTEEKVTNGTESREASEERDKPDETINETSSSAENTTLGKELTDSEKLIESEQEVQ